MQTKAQDSQSSTQINRPADVMQEGGNGDAVARLRRSGDLAGSVLRSIGECVYEWDMEADTLYWSEGTTELLCVKDEGLIGSGRSYRSLLLSTASTSREEVIFGSEREDMGNGVPYRVQYALSGKKLGTSSDIWVEDAGCFFRNVSGKPVRAHGVIRLINERRSVEERLDRLARFDPLTGLYNRSHINAALDGIFAGLPNGGDPAAFLLLSIEHFDLVNTVYGYEAGDAVMMEIADRLKNNLRSIDVLGRFSGARLAIILDDCSERSLYVAGHRILNLFRDDVVETDSGPIAVSLSVGGVLIPEHASDAKQVFTCAQAALTEARRQPDSAIEIYRHDPKRDAAQRKAVVMAEKIVGALRRGDIHLAFQPIVDATTHQIVFHEALLRLTSVDGEAVIAADFVSVAQSLGLIRLVDHHALDLTLKTLTERPSAVVSLNVSNETACDSEWISKLAMAASDDPTLSERLIVEITESHAVESLEETSRFIGVLRDLGFKVALDDFGAGYTSFRNLKELDFDIIKIDGQFASELQTNAENRSFIAALVSLANQFNAKTVVEWVEDLTSADELRKWGVSYLQGAEFGMPVAEAPWPLVPIAPVENEA